MFSNIGNKLKTIAKVVFTVGIIVSMIGALVIAANGDNGYMMLLAALTLGLGVVGAWIAACLVYGFGELVCTNAAIKEKLCGGDDAENSEK